MKGYTLAELRNGTGFDKSARFVQVDNRDEENAAKLQDIGKSAFEALAEMVAALECDYERLEELREAKKYDRPGFADVQELEELESAAGDCKDRDDAEQRIHEDPLSVEVRSEWFNPYERDADRAPAEFRILLGTGGPATQIVGELDASGQPTSATLQAQDWFLPWTDYRGDEVSEETLLTYCRCFYFGEG